VEGATEGWCLVESRRACLAQIGCWGARRSNTQHARHGRCDPRDLDPCSSSHDHPPNPDATSTGTRGRLSTARILPHPKARTGPQLIVDRGLAARSRVRMVEGATEGWCLEDPRRSRTWPVATEGWCLEDPRGTRVRVEGATEGWCLVESRRACLAQIGCWCARRSNTQHARHGRCDPRDFHPRSHSHSSPKPFADHDRSSWLAAYALRVLPHTRRAHLGTSALARWIRPASEPFASSRNASERHGNMLARSRGRAVSLAWRQPPPGPTSVREAACLILLSIHDAITYNKWSPTPPATNQPGDSDQTTDRTHTDSAQHPNPNSATHRRNPTTTPQPQLPTPENDDYRASPSTHDQCTN
jgi:hypothetical protein